MKSRRAASALLMLAFAASAFAAPPPAERPLTALPYTPSLEPAFMDRSVDPCVDFYRYSCGKWVEKNPIPPDRSSWSVYGKAGEDNQRFLWGMLEEAARPVPGRDANTQKIGDYFAACMDEPAIEKAGAAPLQPGLDAIAGLKSKQDLAALIGRLHPGMGLRGMFFGFGSGQDFQSSSEVIGRANSGGLGLPDRDYYLKDDARSKEIRERYQSHVQKVLGLLGDPAPARGAETVMRIETALAKATLTRVEQRDPYKVYHRMTRAGLQALTPSFRWADYLKAIGEPDLDAFNVTQPEFYREFERRIAADSLDDLKTYLRWHLAGSSARYLSAPFVQANFDFYEAFLRGVKEKSPRWKDCVDWVDRDLGEALGEVFVRKAFPPETKAGTQEMVKHVRSVMEKRIQELPWMGEETKKQALLKLHTMRDKIGYPERWRDYSALEVRRGDFLDNVQRALTFEAHRDLGKIGQPVDKNEWGMTPPTVNAYYNPYVNDMNFPAGVLMPPLYDPRLDAAPSYGNTGSTIGHELTHGFDDQGRKFDAEANLRDWWTKEDDAEFRKRVQCVADQYAQYTVIDDIKINSKLTLGEDVADLGGTIIAYLAWKEATRGQKLEPRDGLTPDQRFFVGFAQWDCGGETPESKRLRAQTDPHSPAEYRINGVVVNIPEFAAAFSCKTGQPMVKEPDKVCRVW